MDTENNNNSEPETMTEQWNKNAQGLEETVQDVSFKDIESLNAMAEKIAEQDSMRQPYTVSASQQAEAANFMKAATLDADEIRALQEVMRDFAEKNPEIMEGIQRGLQELSMSKVMERVELTNVNELTNFYEAQQQAVAPAANDDSYCQMFNQAANGEPFGQAPDIAPSAPEVQVPLGPSK